jgi:hypothetical protein
MSKKPRLRCADDFVFAAEQWDKRIKIAEAKIAYYQKLREKLEAEAEAKKAKGGAK